mmetsp:Transcript_11815/g.27540  ORF Transcript_11815/g.27540 Transcript_11815/m.27540 type:complete len:199 (+) Transcript_11815:67-663(+)
MPCSDSRSPSRRRAPARRGDSRDRRRGSAPPRRDSRERSPRRPPPRREEPRRRRDSRDRGRRDPTPPRRRESPRREDRSTERPSAPETARSAPAAAGSENEFYTKAEVVDGVPRADKRPTWRAEISLPRPGAVHGADRGSLCIRGPNRFTEDEALADLEACKVEAVRCQGDPATVRKLVTQLKTDFERKKHVESGHAK